MPSSQGDCCAAVVCSLKPSCMWQDLSMWTYRHCGTQNREGLFNFCMQKNGRHRREELKWWEGGFYFCVFCRLMCFPSSLTYFQFEHCTGRKMFLTNERSKGGRHLNSTFLTFKKTSLLPTAFNFNWLIYESIHVNASIVPSL